MNMKKFLAVAVILLFIGVTFAPSISGIDNEILHRNSNQEFTKERMLRIHVTEYKEDGTTEKTIIKMPRSEVMELGRKLQNIKTPEEKLSLYQEYGLIPQDVSLEKLRGGMLTLAEKLNISEEKLSSLEKSHKSMNQTGYGVGLNFLNEVSLIGFMFFNLPIGLSFFTGPINVIITEIISQLGLNIYFRIPSADLLQLYFMPVIGVLLSLNGIMPDFEMWNVIIPFLPMFCLLIGFVGFCVQFPIFSIVGTTFGFSIATLALGYKV